MHGFLASPTQIGRLMAFNLYMSLFLFRLWFTLRSLLSNMIILVSLKLRVNVWLRKCCWNLVMIRLEPVLEVVLFFFLTQHTFKGFARVYGVLEKRRTVVRIMPVFETVW